MKFVVLTFKKNSLTSLETNFSLGLGYYEINFTTDHLNSKIFRTLLLVQPDLRNFCITYLLVCGLGSQEPWYLCGNQRTTHESWF